MIGEKEGEKGEEMRKREGKEKGKDCEMDD